MSQPLSFGFEVEMCLVHFSADRDDPHPSDPRCARGLEDTNRVADPPNPDVSPRYWANVPATEFVGEAQGVRTHIANTMQRAGLPTRIGDVFAARGPGDERIPHDRSAKEMKWNVITDSSIIGAASGYHTEKIEVNSPAFTYSPAAIRDVHVFCEEMTSNYRVFTNESTGLHVHVGAGAEGFPLEVCQSLFAFLLVFEPTLSTLHPESRIAKGERDNSYLRPIRINSGIASTNPPLSLPIMIRIIFDTSLLVVDSNGKRVYDDSCMHYLWRNMSYGNLAYDLRNLADRGDEFKKTVEFRQHISTLDGEAVAQWIEVCVGIVAFCRNNSKPFLQEFIYSHLQLERAGQAVDIFTLLERIQLPQQAAYYRARGNPNADPVVVQQVAFLAQYKGVAEENQASKDAFAEREQRRLRSLQAGLKDPRSETTPSEEAEGSMPGVRADR